MPEVELTPSELHKEHLNIMKYCRLNKTITENIKKDKEKLLFFIIEGSGASNIMILYYIRTGIINSITFTLLFNGYKYFSLITQYERLLNQREIFVTFYY